MKTLRSLTLLAAVAAIVPVSAVHANDGDVYISYAKKKQGLVQFQQKAGTAQTSAPSPEAAATAEPAAGGTFDPGSVEPAAGGQEESASTASAQEPAKESTQDALADNMKLPRK